MLSFALIWKAESMKKTEIEQIMAIILLVIGIVAIYYLEPAYRASHINNSVNRFNDFKYLKSLK